MVDITAAEVFRDFVTDGIPSSGVHRPRKPDIRSLLKRYEAIIAAFMSSGGTIYASKASLDADLARPANTMAWVLGDAVAANNGIYRKVGASGAGNWVRASDLPYSFILASNAAAGTPSAIQATTSVPVSGSALILLQIAEDYAGEAATVSFNGGAALAIKTNSGADVRSLSGGSVVYGVIAGEIFRLANDEAIANLVYQARDEAIDASDRSEAEADRSRDEADRSEDARDTAAALVSDTVSQGNVPVRNSLAAAAMEPVKDGINKLLVFSAEGGVFTTVDNGNPVVFSSPPGEGATAKDWRREADLSFPRMVAGTIREKLTSDRVLFVRTDGSDDNDGLANSAGGAFLTIGRALQEVIRAIDFDGRNVTIDVQDGSYSEVVSLYGPLVGGGTLTILGNTADWDAVEIEGGFQAFNGAQFAVRGFKIGSIDAGVWSIYSYGNGSKIQASHINFGAVTGGGDHLFASDLAAWEIDGPYKISGGALNHYHVTERGWGRVSGQVVPVEGNPHFTGQFAGIAGGLMVVGVTFSGGATGREYLVHYNGEIRAGQDTSNVFPGDLPGVSQAGGRLDYGSCILSHRNGVDQSISGGDWRQVNLGTVALERGGNYDAANSAWRPPAGAIALAASVTFQNLTAGELCGVSIFKNGVEYKSSLSPARGGPSFETFSISVPYEESDGTPAYQVFARGGDTGSRTIIGSTAWTWFNARQY
ncbi:hypothetical protein ACQZ6V_10700 [Agrobacterium sp. 22-3674b3]